MTFQFLDVGMGDGTLVQISQAGGAAGDILVLVDFGENRSPFKLPYKEAMVYLVDTINENSKTRGLDVPFIDYLFITHGDRDHYNKIEELTKQKFTNFPKKTLRFGKLFYGGEEKDYEGLIGKLKPLVDSTVADLGNKEHATVDATAKIVTPSWPIGDGVKLYLLSCNYPTRASAATNPKSIVLLFELDGQKVILQGDAEKEVEDFIIETFGAVPNFLQAFALKLGHHGGKNATTEPWLKATKPRLAFASGDIVWAHPYCETICRVLDNKSLMTLDEFIWYSCGSGAKDEREYYNNRTNLGVCMNLWYVVKKSAENLKTNNPDPKDVVGFVGNTWGVQWGLKLDGDVGFDLRVTYAVVPRNPEKALPGWDCKKNGGSSTFREIVGHGPPAPLEFIP
jgi:competence protein ComEC